jgi:hypothetical protein
VATKAELIDAAAMPAAATAADRGTTSRACFQHVTGTSGVEQVAAPAEIAAPTARTSTPDATLTTALDPQQKGK